MATKYKAPKIKPSKVGSLNKAMGKPALSDIPALKRRYQTASPAMKKKIMFAVNFNLSKAQRDKFYGKNKKKKAA